MASELSFPRLLRYSVLYPLGPVQRAVPVCGSLYPGLLPGADPYAQSKSSFDPALPLLNAASFESPNSFNFYLGQGPRIANFRAPGYRNQDFALGKNSRISERVSMDIRAELFNMWNWHAFVCQEFCSGSLAFINDVSSPTFGMWNGSASAPRNIQLSMKFLF